MVYNYFDKERLIIALKKIYADIDMMYKKLFEYSYENDKVFKKYIDSQYNQYCIKGKVKEKWNDKFCQKLSSSLINKILFLRICQDKEIIEDEIDMDKLFIILVNYSFEELISFAFSDIGESSKILNYNREKLEIFKVTKTKLDITIREDDEVWDGLINDYKKLIIDAFEMLKRNNFNFKYADGNVLGDVYEKFMDRKIRKSMGQFYTPQYIIDYILQNTLTNADVVKNPFISVADISCGSGHFLIKAYDILVDKFQNNLLKLREIYSDDIYTIKRKGKVERLKGKEYWEEKNIHYHILKHCIYGADVDNFAVQLSTINLILKDPDNFTNELNIIQCDSLVNWEEYYDCKDLEEEPERIIKLNKFFSNKFDCIIGNPPYIGHKQLRMEYKSWLLKKYGEVFKDKSDISFCFFKRALDLLKDNGICGIITSRYFMESPTGKKLRKYLRKNCGLIKIIDFYGVDIFKGVGVATAIYIFSKGELENSKVLVYKLSDDNFSFKDDMDLHKLLNKELFNRFYIDRELLQDERWLLISDEQLNIYRKIINSTRERLGDIVDSFQGIITGCDKAFVMTKEEAKNIGAEKKLLKKWIKNSKVQRYEIIDSDYVLIYSDLIDNELEYPNSIGFIYKYRNRLENRRECRTGARKWYQLQWGRNEKLFEQPKIVFPYKSTNNRFAIDYNSYYCSADVYSFIVKDDYKEQISLEYLAGILNSSIYEFYFKLFAKKMGKGVYDYYPNSVMDLRIVTGDIIKQVEEKVSDILNKHIEIKKLGNTDDGRYLKIKKEILELEKDIDFIIGDSMGLSKEEINTINVFSNNKNEILS